MTRYDSIDPRIWGGAGWRFLFSLAATYPDRPDPTKRGHMVDLLVALTSLLPCAKCGEHFADALRAGGGAESVASEGHAGVFRLFASAYNRVRERMGMAPVDNEGLESRFILPPHPGRGLPPAAIVAIAGLSLLVVVMGIVIGYALTVPDKAAAWLFAVPRPQVSPCPWPRPERYFADVAKIESYELPTWRGG